MNGISRNDLEFCWAQVLRYDPWFRLHHLFAPRTVAGRVLALHALFAMFERSLMMSEESLGVTQLAWWQAELRPERASVSSHPVVRALNSSGALQKLPQELLQSLAVQSLERLRAEPVNDRQELKALCRQIGEPGVQMELAVGTGGVEPELFRGRCSGTGLGSLVNLAVRDPTSTFWFVPLELQARHDCDLRAIGKPEGTAATELFMSLRDCGSAWFDEQVEILAHADGSITSPENGCKHLLASMLSQKLRFTRTMEDLARGGSGNPGRWGLSDFLRVWTICRRQSF